MVITHARANFSRLKIEGQNSSFLHCTSHERSEFLWSKSQSLCQSRHSTGSRLRAIDLVLMREEKLCVTEERKITKGLKLAEGEKTPRSTETARSMCSQDVTQKPGQVMQCNPHPKWTVWNCTPALEVIIVHCSVAPSFESLSTPAGFDYSFDKLECVASISPRPSFLLSTPT